MKALRKHLMMKCLNILVILFAGFVVQCWSMSISELEDFANFLKKTSQLDETLRKGTDPNDFDDEDAISDHAWEDSGKFEGDLILNERQRRMIVEEIAEGLSRNGLRDSTKRWPDNEVIYYIQKEHFTGDQVQAIQTGIDDLAQASCVKFRPYRKGDRDAVVIQGNRRGCFSQVGYQGGYQVLNLSGRHPVGRGCFRHGTVVHELLHTLGFYHMQSSPDRDDYVDIVWENIVKPARHNFRKYNAFSVSDFGVGYDYDSVLHYSRRAFSSNGQDTIVPKQGGSEIGQRVGLSDKDTQKLNKMYCDADNNNDEDDITPTKPPSKKKNPKNKPFEGHGIGYHQGKTVIIKLLPSDETYRIITKPAFPMFHHFSKTPQVLSPEKVEGLDPGKRIVDSYKPYAFEEAYNDQGRNVNNHNNLETISTNIDGYPREHFIPTKQEADDEQKKTENDQGNSDKSSEEVSDDELNAALRRLTKILKTHVYPTHSPDLKVYKVNTDYSEFEDPKKLPNIAYRFVPTSSKEERDGVSAEYEYIKSLYKDGPEISKPEIRSVNPEKFAKIVYSFPISAKQIQKDEEIDSPESLPNKGNSKSSGNVAHPSNPAKQKTLELVKPKEMYEIVVTQKMYTMPEQEGTYRTAYPLKVRQIISNGSLELKTPDYASYENLKDKNNYSALYLPYSEESDEESEKKYKTLGEYVPTYDHWYQDYAKHNPVDYDRPSFTYALPGSKSDIRIHDHAESSENDPSHLSEYTGSFSPATKQAYTLYGEPVPLSQNWYKVNSQKLIEYPYSYYMRRENLESNEDMR